MSLITAPIVINSHIYARIFFILLKNILKQTIYARIYFILLKNILKQT